MAFTKKKDETTWKTCDFCRETKRVQNNPTKHVKPTMDAKPFDAGAHLARVNREEQVYANVEASRSQAASQCLPCKKPEAMRQTNKPRLSRQRTSYAIHTHNDKFDHHPQRL